MLKTIILIEADAILKEFFLRVFYIDGFEIVYLKHEQELSTIRSCEIENVDLVVIDECSNPANFRKELSKIAVSHNITRKIPILGVLKKGSEPQTAHENFDAVLVKDNFNIQLLTDSVERLTSK